MKKLEFRIYEREEIQDLFDKALARVKEYDDAMANGKHLTDFGRFCYDNAKKQTIQFGRYLQMDRKEYVLLGGRLCDYVFAPYTEDNGKDE